jgi:hypothetical protein
MLVYYLVAQRPNEVQHKRIFHDLYTLWIQPSIGEPCGPSDCMWLVPETEPSSENWLQEYVSEAVSRPLCTMIGCTTCGAYEFRSGLYVRIAGSDTPRLSAAARAEILLGLMSELKPPEPASFPWELAADGAEQLLLKLMGELRRPERVLFKRWEKAVRLMIYGCWSDLGGNRALPLLQNRLRSPGLV